MASLPCIESTSEANSSEVRADLNNLMSTVENETLARSWCFFIEVAEADQSTGNLFGVPSDSGFDSLAVNACVS